MAGLILQKQIGGNWHFVQSLNPIPLADRAAYLAATYGKRADQFRIVQDGPADSEASERAAWYEFERTCGHIFKSCPSAASLILAKITRPPTAI